MRLSDVQLYKEPATRAQVLIRVLAGGEGATVRCCRGKWLYVEHMGEQGGWEKLNDVLAAASTSSPATLPTQSAKPHP